ncbi:MAG TPA: GAF domain-containing protein, partial [Anaerolineae bacterium]|nr:GAF domain-containing protein [Anaerolineae bacterium]
RLLPSIARAVRESIALRERTALRAQVNRQSQEFNALYTIGKEITSMLDLEEILKSVVRAAVNLIQAEEGSLFLIEPESGELMLRASHNLLTAELGDARIKVHDSLLGRVVSSGRPVSLNRSDFVKIRTSFLVKAIVAVPIKIGERVIGVVSVDNKLSNRTFLEHEVHLLSALAGYAAIAIENGKLFGAVQQHANELAALIEIDRNILSTANFKDTALRILKIGRELLNADDSEIYLLEPDGQTLQAIVAIGEYADAIMAQSLRLGEGLVGHIAQSRVAEFVNDARGDARGTRVPNTPDVPEALMCAPLISKGQLVGVMTLTRKAGHAPFTDSDLNFLIGLAGQAAIAIESARLFSLEQDRAVELAEALTHQEEVDRLKNEFIQNISHELRTPLTIIHGYSNLLASGELGALDAEQHEAAEIVARRARMLGVLVDDLVSMLAIDRRTLKREPVDLANLIEATLVDFDEVAKNANLSLQAAVNSRAPIIVSADTMLLRRALDNLVGNALKFTPSGGHIDIRLTRADSQAVIEVEDTGIGIPPDKIARVFDRFYQVDGTTKRRYGGLGLGLALVKETIDVHGGTVEASSRVGEGSTFRVRLPIS